MKCALATLQPTAAATCAGRVRVAELFASVGLPNSISTAHGEIAMTARELPLRIAAEIAERLRHANMELDVRLQYKNQLPANKRLIAGKLSKCLGGP